MGISTDRAKYFRALHLEALGVCRGLEKEEYHLIEILQKIGHEKAYRFLGYKSLFQFEEGTKFISENTLELRAAISEETDGVLRRVQDVLSQNQGKPVSMDGALKAMAKLFLEKNDPVIKASRILKKKIKKDSSQRLVNIKEKVRKPLPPLSTPFREPLAQAIKHNIYFRDQGQCQAKNPDGKPCDDSRWIDIHHIVPKSKGGLDTIENLVTLCKGHHRLEHIEISDKQKFRTPEEYDH